MDKETETLIDTIAERAASNAIAKVREFHKDDLKVLRERMDIGFETVDRQFEEVNERLGKVEQRFDSFEVRFDRVENALATLLDEFKADKEKQKQLEAKVAQLTERVRILEAQLAHQ